MADPRAPNSIAFGGAGALARQATTLGALCRAVPPATSAVSLVYAAAKGLNAPIAWSTSVLVLLSAAVMSSTPWRQRPGILAAASVLAAAVSVLAFTAVFHWASSGFSA